MRRNKKTQIVLVEVSNDRHFKKRKKKRGQMPKDYISFVKNTANWHRHFKDINQRKKERNRERERMKKRTYTHSKQYFVILLVEYR